MSSDVWVIPPSQLKQMFDSSDLPENNTGVVASHSWDFLSPQANVGYVSCWIILPVYVKKKKKKALNIY